MRLFYPPVKIIKIRYKIYTINKLLYNGPAGYYSYKKRYYQPDPFILRRIIRFFYILYPFYIIYRAGITKGIDI